MCNFKATAHSQKLIAFKIKSSGFVFVFESTKSAMLEAESSNLKEQTFTEYLTMQHIWGAGIVGW